MSINFNEIILSPELQHFQHFQHISCMSNSGDEFKEAYKNSVQNNGVKLGDSPWYIHGVLLASMCRGSEDIQKYLMIINEVGKIVDKKTIQSYSKLKINIMEKADAARDFDIYDLTEKLHFPIIFNALGLAGDQLSHNLPKLKALIDIGMCVNTQILDRNIRYSFVYPNSQNEDIFVPKNATPLWVAAEKICDLNLVAYLVFNGAIAQPELSKEGHRVVNNALKPYFDQWKTVSIANDRDEGSFAELSREAVIYILEKLTKIYKQDM